MKVEDPKKIEKIEKVVDDIDALFKETGKKLFGIISLLGGDYIIDLMEKANKKIKNKLIPKEKGE